MTSVWKDRRVFVTGGNGFLGSHITGRLVDAGATVICLIKEEIPLSRFTLDGTEDRVVCVHGIVEDSDLIYDVLCGWQIDAVFHLAAQPIVTEAVKDPLPTWESNVRGTYSVLEAVRQYGGARSVVVASSDKVYGETEKLPYREDCQLGGLSPYDTSKVCTDVIAQSYAKTYDLPIGIARCGNFYGPGDLQWSRIVPGTIRSLLQGERPVIRSDGTPERDYFYVEDAADAFLTLGAELLSRPDLGGEAFNFGTGKPTSVSTVVQKLIACAGQRVEPVVLGEARGEIQAQYLDCSKAKETLGWSHQTEFSEGADRAWAWYRRVFKEHGFGNQEALDVHSRIR